MTIKVGDGRKTKFSGDAWNNQNPLKDIFLDLIITCNNLESIVKECSTDHGCDVSFRRLLNIKLLGGKGGQHASSTR